MMAPARNEVISLKYSGGLVYKIQRKSEWRAYPAARWLTSEGDTRDRRRSKVGISLGPINVR